MTIIDPTVGRTVYFEPGTPTPPGMTRNGELPFMAFVTYVWSASMVNLLVLDHNGASWPLTSVRFKNDTDAESPQGQYGYWMPYQVGQAKQDRGGDIELVKLAESTAAGEPMRPVSGAVADLVAEGDAVDAEVARAGTPSDPLSPGENTINS